MPSSLYEDAGGFDKILALCRRWHVLCLADPEAAHPFEHPLHPQHDERLAAYLAEAFGGPKLYTAGYGTESYVTGIHACNGVHVELDEACMRQFVLALADVGITGPAAERISAYFLSVMETHRGWSEGQEIPADLPLNIA